MNLIRFLTSKLFILNFAIAFGILTVIVLFVSKVWMPIRTQQNEIVTVPNINKKNLFEAIKMLEEAELNYKIDTFRYEPKYPSYQISYIYPNAGAEVKKGRTVLIKANAKSWRPVVLPNLINNSKRLAFTKIKSSDLFVGDTIYEPDLAKDVVLRILYKGREIKVGEIIPRFSKIDVVLGKGQKTNVPVPNVEGLTLEQAKYVIEQNFFEIGKIKYLFKKSKDSTNLKVYYQDPAPKDYFDEGKPIDLWVSDISKDSLQNQIKNLHKIYRKYLFDSLGKLISIDEIKEASKQVIIEKEIKTKMEQMQKDKPPIDEGISIE